METSSGFEIVTPERAAKWIAKRPYEYQRAINPHRVAVYADSMKRGFWRRGDGRILFGCYGDRAYLMQGQHRLHAVVLAGVPVELEIGYRPYESMDAMQRDYAVMDNGQSRTKSHALASLGTASRLNVNSRWTPAFGSALAAIAGNFRQDRNIRDIALANPDELDAALMLWEPQVSSYYGIAQTASTKHMVRLRRVMVIAVGLLTLRYQPTRSVEFWTLVANNEGLRKGEPAYTLNQYLIDYPAKTSSEYAEAVARAWNAYFEKRSLAYLRANGGAVEIAGTPFTSKRSGAFDVLNPEEVK